MRPERVNPAVHASGNRRRFLSLLTSAILMVIGLIVAVPAFLFAFAPLRGKRRHEGMFPEFADAGPLGNLPLREWRLLSLDIVHEDGWRKTRTRHAIWVRRQDEGEREITVFSSICPHLGCPINWIPGESQFLCPCHGGSFDSEGRHTAGPPPRSMDPLEFEVRAGSLWVRWQDFKIGTAERIPVSV